MIPVIDFTEFYAQFLYYVGRCARVGQILIDTFKNMPNWCLNLLGLSLCCIGVVAMIRTFQT